MKSNFLLIITIGLSSISGFSQRQGSITKLEDSGIRLSETRYRAPAKSTLGSPYINKAFFHAKVGDIISNALMRYNASSDEFEFINSTNDTLSLNKTAAFNNITFTYPKLDYFLVNYAEKNGRMNMGYLIKLYDKNNIILYKRQKITYYEATIAKSSYDTPSPAKYVLNKDTFFIKNKESEITEVPTSKKGFLKLFPEKKVEIEGFVKQNNTDFEKEQDLIKLADFLAQ